MNECDYYLFGESYDENYATVDAEEDQDLEYLLRGKKVDDFRPVRMYITDDKSDNPVIADYHPVENVFSAKVKRILENFEIDYIQFIPVIIRGFKNEIFKDYWLLNICKRIRCLDLEKSEYDIGRKGKVRNLNKIVLDQEKLVNIPLKERLIFELEESLSKILFHKSVGDAILKSSPKGIRFYTLEEYYDGIQFE